MKNIKWLSLHHLFKDNIVQETMVSLGNSIELPALFRKLGWRIIFTIFTKKGNVAYRLKVLTNFGTYLLRLRSKHGPKYVVSYLKSCQLAIQKAIAKDKISSLREIEPSYSFPRLSSSGLPRYIPLRDRRAIMNGSTSIIRFWLTLYSVYRVISIPGKLKLETITSPLTVPEQNVEKVAFDLRVLTLRLKSMFPIHICKNSKGLLLLESASSTHSVAWLGILSDPFLLKEFGLGDTMVSYLREMGYSNLLDYWSRITRIEWLPNILLKSKEVLGIGQLSRKLEPAGKVRVFAMVDVWTQSALMPLHNMLSTFLKSLPNDGTFDQTASWKRAAEKSLRSGFSFGYDLSAATDRLPIELQVAILSPLIGDRAATLWKDLLVGRAYTLKGEKTDDFKVKSLKYAVGQPMGALSSWAMLAVTHHLLVQLCYRKVTGRENDPRSYWFDNYEITGDDINIFDQQVAHEYLSLMSFIGVPINTSKSVVATIPSAEYVKVTTLRGVNVSALSWRMFISQNTLGGRINILYSLMNKDYLPSKDFKTWLTSVVAKNRFKDGLVQYAFIPLLSMFANSGRFSWEDLIKALFNPLNPKRSLYKNIVLGVNMDYIVNIINSIRKGQEPRLRVMDSTWSSARSFVVTSLRQELENRLRYSRETIVSPSQVARLTIDQLMKYSYRHAIIIVDDIMRLLIPKVLHDEYFSDRPRLRSHVDDLSSIGEVMTDIIADHTKRYESVKLDFTNATPVSEMIELLKEVDRVRELTLLSDRAFKKIRKDPVSMSKKTNEIKIVKSLLRSYQLREKFFKTRLAAMAERMSR